MRSQKQTIADKITQLDLADKTDAEIASWANNDPKLIQVGRQLRELQQIIRWMIKQQVR